jgi:hypothetical protein
MEQTNGRAERVINQTRALNDDVRGLASEISSAAKEIRAKVDLGPMVQEHPFRTVLIAAGVGYVLGGGLFTPLTGTLVRVGARAMLLPMLRNQLSNLAAGAAQEPA